jgi:predicted nucleic acid-binding protein
MILYLDTSALLKRYFKEPYSDEIISRWKGATEIVTSSVAYAETMASFYRKKREVGLSDKVIKKIVNSFRMDWKSFIRVELTDDLNEYIDKAVGSHPLRGFDAIHLASALTVHEMLPEDFLFACFDRRLTHAAQVEGLETFPLNSQ